MSLDPAVCERARLARDARFDGLFFTAVQTTGIYCRPMCPAPPPLAKHVRYFAHAAAAEAAGYRPCLRCRPELSPQDGAWRCGDAALARALALIEAGVLGETSVAELAAQVHLSERQLRRLFTERLGAAPLRVDTTRRLLFAKQLLTETALPVTDIALAAGFASLRRFHAAFQAAYRMAPLAVRQQQRAPLAAGPLTLRLAYRPPLDWRAWLAFVRERALPGVEQVDDTGYRRTLGSTDSPGWLHLEAAPDGTPQLRLTLHGVPTAALPDAVRRVRRMADLDADPQAVRQALRRLPRLAALAEQAPGLRLPGGWCGFEMAVRAVIGQQISVAAARTVVGRIVAAHGMVVDWGAASGRATPSHPSSGLTRLFPKPETLAEADLTTMGLTTRRAATVRAVAAAWRDGEVDVAPGQTLESFVQRWMALPGIGAWTAQYLALRALGHPDAFPDGDLVLQRMASGDRSRWTAEQLRTWAEPARPWRGYAAIHLWRAATLETAT